MSYTGGSLNIKLGASVAKECPAKFWLSAIGVERKYTPIFFKEGTLLHACAEVHHKAKFAGLDQLKAVNGYLSKACHDKTLRTTIRSYFDAYLEYSSSRYSTNIKNATRQKATHSEKKYESSSICLKTGSVISDKYSIQGRIDLIEDIMAVPVSESFGRTFYVEVGEILNSFDKIKNGDEYLSHDGYNYLIKNILNQKPIAKKDSVSISGADLRREQELESMKRSIEAVRVKTIKLDSVTTDIKTSSGPLVSRNHFEQVSFYSYLRTIVDREKRTSASIINIQKNKDKKIGPKRSRSIFSINQNDFDSSIFLIQNAINVIDTKCVKQKKESCFHPIYRSRCPYYSICHFSDFKKEGISAREAMSDLTIKEFVL